MKKATNEQILESYKKFNSIWKVADELGMCGQSVHERLKRMEIKLNNPKMLDEEKKLIFDLYNKGFKTGDGQLEKLSKKINRTIPLISRYAKSMNLTNYNRNLSQTIKNNISKKNKELIKKNGHPKGFLNHTHNNETRKKIAEKSTLFWMRITKKEYNDLLIKRAKAMVNNNNKTGLVGDKKKTWKSQWQTIGGKRNYFRSEWEVKYAYYLEYLKNNNKINDWEYESKVFFFKNSKVIMYRPDFTVYDLNNKITYHEVKGWFDERSIEIFKLIKEQYPKINLIVIDKSKYKPIEKFINQLNN
jgi:hypothetical protein